MIAPTPGYYRRDQADGVTPPNLADEESTYAEHIVHARGKRTRFTSLSDDPSTIADFGPQLWRLRQLELRDGGHRVEHHDALIQALRVQTGDARPDVRQLARKALQRAQKRREALVIWCFNISGVAPKALPEWARPHVRPYFARA